MKNITALEQEQIDMNAQIAAMQWENRFEEDERNNARNPQTKRLNGRAPNGGMGEYGNDEGLVVHFTSVAVLNKMASVKAGVPKYIDQEMITIIVPGEAGKLLSCHSPATDFYIWRFPTEYKNFKDGKDLIQTGTPLSHWLEMTPSKIKQLEFYNVRTVEQVANLADSSTGIMDDFYGTRERAKQFLLDANDKAKTSVLQMQIDAQAAQHATEIAEMKAQMAAFIAAASATPRAPTPKRVATAKKVIKTDK